MRYCRACGSYHDFLDIWLLLTRKVLNQGFLVVMLKWSHRKFYSHHYDLVNSDRISVSQMTTDISVCRNQNQVISSFMTCHPLCIKSSTTGATCGAGNAYPRFFPEDCLVRSLVICVVICRSWFVFFHFAIVLSVLIRFTAFDYPFGIFKLFLLFLVA